jgi:hypothetical protein
MEHSRDGALQATERDVLTAMVLSESLAGHVLGGICLIAGIGFLIAGSQDSGLNKALANGKKVEGSVVHAADRTENVARKGGQTTLHSYFLTVLYTVDTKLNTKEFQVTEDAYRSHPAGSKVEVVYDPANPQTSDLTGGLSARSSTSEWVRGGVIAAIGIAFLAYGRHAGKKQSKSTPV